MTNAYLYTGDEKYKKWVLDYVGGWIERIRANDGVIPDNVGPTGKIGEHRDGQWWGGLHGWSSSESAADRLFLGLIVGAQCAHLLSGDDYYLEVLRSQIVALLDRGKTEHGELVVPKSHGPDGWTGYAEFSIRGGPTHLVNLWHESMSQGDYELVTRVRDGGGTDWNELPPIGDRGGARTEFARFQYYDGKNPDWPVQCLQADYQQVADFLEGMMRDTRTVQQIIADNAWPPNPVIVKGLVQTTMGCPGQLYNGGILRATVRYFDADASRPGLPPDVAALVDDLSANGCGIQLVNTSHSECRNLIVQSGAFGEHSFTEVEFTGTDYSSDDLNPNTRVRSSKTATANTIQVNGKHFTVTLPPMTSVRLACGLRRFVNDPSYAFPWHGGEVPVE